MSYILDALRKAEAERERGAVPGIHAQQYAQMRTDDEPARRITPMAWAAAGAAIVVAAAAAWGVLRRDAAPGVAVAVAAAGPARQVPPVVAPNAQPALQLGASVSALAGAPTLSSAPPATRSPSPLPTAPDRRAALAPSPPVSLPTIDSRKAPREPVPSPAPENDLRESAPQPASPVAPTNAARDRLYAEADLPDEVRRELPKVLVSGSAYSSDATSRMLMINGQIFHEGDALGPNLVLDKIKPHGAVLTFKGYRYEIAY